MCRHPSAQNWNTLLPEAFLLICSDGYSAPNHSYLPCPLGEHLNSPHPRPRARTRTSKMQPSINFGALRQPHWFMRLVQGQTCLVPPKSVPSWPVRYNPVHPASMMCANVWKKSAIMRHRKAISQQNSHILVGTQNWTFEILGELSGPHPTVQISVAAASIHSSIYPHRPLASALESLSWQNFTATHTN